MTERIVVVGSTGFVGAAVVDAITEDFEIGPVRAPRLRTSCRTERDLVEEVKASPVVQQLASEFDGAAIVINAAGDPDASSLDEDALYGANALLPGLLLMAAQAAGVRRFVHVSSAVVQNDKPLLDSSEDLRPFSP